MSFYDKLLVVNQERKEELRLTNDEAYLAIVFSAIASDEEVNREEMLHLTFLLQKFHGFQFMSQDQFQEMFDRFQKIIDTDGIGTLINVATDTLDLDLRETAYANAVELVLADGVVHAQEKEFLITLQKAIDIKDTMAEKIIEVLLIKNRGTTSDIFANPTPDKMFYV